MANILEKYGVKEVADFTLYQIGTNGEPGAPYAIFDSLKVSTPEMTAEETFARGGKGNPKLIGWDFNKEITVNLEDALFSARSLSLGWSNGDVSEDAPTITKTIWVTDEITTWINPATGEEVDVTNVEYTDVAGETVVAASIPTTGCFATFTITLTGGTKINITPDKFAGTYYAVGETYARNETTGKDELMYLVIPKVKVSSEATLTLEAEGDPSTFPLKLSVMRAKDTDGAYTMMYLAQGNPTASV